MSRQYAIGSVLGGGYVIDEEDRDFALGQAYVVANPTGVVDVDVDVTGQALTASVGTAYYVPEGIGVFDPTWGTNRTLSNGGRTTTSTGSGEAATATGHTTGKYYAEFWGITVVGYTQIGFTDDDYVPYLLLGTDGTFDGSFGLFDPAWAYNSGDVVSIAINLTTQTAWWRVNGGAWIPDGDPVAGTGGFTPTTGAYTDVRLIVWQDAAGAIVSLLSGPEFIYTAPSGFSAWDAAIQHASTIAGDQQVVVSVGTVTATGKANVTLQGQELTASVGAATVTAGGSVSITVAGQELTSSVGLAAVTAIAFVSADAGGQSVTASVGTATVTAKQNVSVQLEGQMLISLVGHPSVTGVVEVGGEVEWAGGGQMLHMARFMGR